MLTPPFSNLNALRARRRILTPARLKGKVFTENGEYFLQGDPGKIPIKVTGLDTDELERLIDKSTVVVTGIAARAADGSAYEIEVEHLLVLAENITAPSPVKRRWSKQRSS